MKTFKINSRIFIFCISIFLFGPITSQIEYKGPIPKIETGIGAPGSYTVKTDYLTLQPDSNKYKTYDPTLAFVSYPAEKTTPSPLLIFVPWDFDSRLGKSEMYAIHQTMSERFVSQGYAYATLQWNNPAITQYSYNLGLLMTLCDTLQNSFSDRIDTTRVGFMGTWHGAPRAMQIASMKFQYGGWGENGRFIWIDHSFCAIVQSNPWEATKPVFSNKALDEMPDDVKFLVTEGDLTHFNDPSFAIDFYKNIGVADSNKAFLEFDTDSLDGYVYLASEVAFLSQAKVTLDTWERYVVYDAYDEYIYSRTLHALAQYTWEGNYAARSYCLGTDERGEITMPGGLKGIANKAEPRTDRYWVAIGRGYYTFPCAGLPYNQRLYEDSFPCWPTLTANISKIKKENHSIDLYPNPISQDEYIFIKKVPRLKYIHLYSSSGSLIDKIELDGRLDITSIKNDYGIKGVVTICFFDESHDIMDSQHVLFE